MLKQVLSEIESAPAPLDIRDLSRRLGVDPSALEGMIQFWVQKGRLSDDALIGRGATPECGGGPCAGSCPGPDACPFVIKLPHSYSLKQKS